MTIDKVKQGKRNKRNGATFELSVRHDLESKGWIVSKWQNNVEKGKLISARHKFNPFRGAMSMGTGFPDFIAYRRVTHISVPAGFDMQNATAEEISNAITDKLEGYEVIGVEAKTNGYLDKEESTKCKWLIDNKIFSNIIIAKKDGKEIIYTEWKSK